MILSHIEDYTSAWIVTQRHNCDVREDTDQSNHTIPKTCWQSCALIGPYFFDVTILTLSNYPYRSIIFDMWYDHSIIYWNMIPYDDITKFTFEIWSEITKKNPKIWCQILSLDYVVYTLLYNKNLTNANTLFINGF